MLASLQLAALAFPLKPSLAGDLELPNLVAFPPVGIRIGLADDDPTARAIRFDTRTANLGDYHLEVLGEIPEQGSTASPALQCVDWDGRICVERQEVGKLDVHLQHGHWHLAGFALYELRRLTGDGTPDLSEEGLVVDGGKASSCLVDVVRMSSPSPVEDPFTYTGYYRGCVSLIQGISRGWMDVYFDFVEGQQLLLEDVPDGRYAVVITTNPDHVLLETSTDDNMTWKAFQLSNGGTSLEPIDR